MVAGAEAVLGTVVTAVLGLAVLGLAVLALVGAARELTAGFVTEVVVGLLLLPTAPATMKMTTIAPSTPLITLCRLAHAQSGLPDHAIVGSSFLCLRQSRRETAGQALDAVCAEMSRAGRDFPAGPAAAHHLYLSRHPIDELGAIPASDVEPFVP